LHIVGTGRGLADSGGAGVKNAIAIRAATLAVGTFLSRRQQQAGATAILAGFLTISNAVSATRNLALSALTYFAETVSRSTAIHAVRAGAAATTAIPVSLRSIEDRIGASRRRADVSNAVVRDARAGVCTGHARAAPWADTRRVATIDGGFSLILTAVGTGWCCTDQAITI